MLTMPLSLYTLFLQGGAGFMTVITILLLAILFCAWKFPRLVKLLGNFALAFSAFSTLFGLMQAADAIACVGGMEPVVIWDGVKVCLITILYGLIVYGVSLIARMINSFRK